MNLILNILKIMIQESYHDGVLYALFITCILF